jgi:hypothetical protein
VGLVEPYRKMNELKLMMTYRIWQKQLRSRVGIDESAPEEIEEDVCEEHSKADMSGH